MKLSARLKQSLAAIVFAALVITVSAVYAANQPSDWARAEVRAAESAGLVPAALVGANYVAEIQRDQLCMLMITAYEKSLSVTVPNPSRNPFKDCTDKFVMQAYSLGIVSGVTDTTFEPKRSVTRQEISKMLCNFATALGEDIGSSDESILSGFGDESSIAAWARPFISRMVSAGVLKGYEYGDFKPYGSANVEQAIIMVARLVGASDKAPLSLSASAGKPELSVSNLINMQKKTEAPDINPDAVNSGTGDISVKCEIEGTTAVLKWDGKSDYEYTVTIDERRDSYYPELIEPNETVTFKTMGNVYAFDAWFNRVYALSVTDSNGRTASVEFTTDKPKGNIDIFKFGEINTEEDARAVLETVTVPRWKFEDGKKVPSTIDITIHKALASDVIEIFNEIYQSPEQFPINTVADWAWRTRGSGILSEHALGSAIDINAEQNYCVYSSGDTVGSYWKPYEDPLSITPYGDVIKIFESHGWTWGGDAWRNPQDYMHFSYYGN